MNNSSRSNTRKTTQKIAPRRAGGRSTRRGRPGRMAQWFLTALGFAYGLAVIWTSLVYAAEGHPPFTTASGPAADPPAFVEVEPPPPGLLGAAGRPAARASARPFAWPSAAASAAGAPAAPAISSRDASLRDALSRENDPRDVRGYVQSAARQGGVDPTVAEWIVSHESAHRPAATGDGGDSRGLWQINRVWHPEVSDRCAYDVRCSTRWSIQRLRDGYANEWSTWRFRHAWFANAPQSLLP